MNNNNGISLEQIEKVIYRNADDIAISIARSFERLEERIDAAESRLYSRFAEVEDKIEGNRAAIADSIDDIRKDIHEILQSREDIPSVD